MQFQCSVQERVVTVPYSFRATSNILPRTAQWEVTKTKLSVSQEGGAADGGAVAEAVEATAEAALPPAKQLRKLRKKMKQIAQLEVKRADGTELNAEQEKKLAAKDELAAAIVALEALGLE